jgi:hypothetical protein
MLVAFGVGVIYARLGSTGHTDDKTYISDSFYNSALTLNLTRISCSDTRDYPVQTPKVPKPTPWKRRGDLGSSLSIPSHCNDRPGPGTG